MARFASDVDILRYEPVLFGELHLRSQVRAAGIGAVLSGTTLTAESADFVNAGVGAGSVVYLRSDDGVPDGAYEIVSVEGATELTLSVLRANPDDDPIAPPAAESVSYRISTFDPQAIETACELTAYFGIQPGNPASAIDVEQVTDTTVLRRASVFAVISAVYAMWAGEAKSENLWKKSLHYRKHFEQARRQCRLSVDLGADGIADVTAVGSAIKLVRD
ncbi:MAG: hypothetical protein JW993_02145 [Sedimentisphaerales bacterium]|nr:hypothetical protein [Sedimentisphaerales bacterium]